ncbi:hypothetical protein AVEN_128484-1 [Araneus ventricosus]|uniref:Uncharacterized protein n=1 Tax=Araneus ventricosus TaxID=182803 RepID=A0A4Y2FS26_ARAVE|nr:hypothetical protein AVEN_128484-1 [Araneus ventricosus]
MVSQSSWKVASDKAVGIGTFCGIYGSFRHLNIISQALNRCGSASQIGQWISPCGYSTSSGGLPRVTSSRASTQNHFKGPLGLTGPPAIHTKSQCNGQHRLCHGNSLVTPVFFYS